MSDDSRIPAPPQPQVWQYDVQDLATQMHGMRRWMGWMTAIMALVVLSSCLIGTLGIAGFALLVGSSSADTLIDDEQVGAARVRYEKALGSDLASLKVRRVTVEYPDESFMDPTEEALYVEYRLKGSSVLFAAVVQPDENALIPTQGSLPSVLSSQQFRAIVSAYGAQSVVPFGGVYHYSDAPFGAERLQGEVSIAGKDYPTKYLWVVAPGVRVQGDVFRTETLSKDAKARALIFQEDPKTHTFTYIASDDSDDWIAW